MSAKTLVIENPSEKLKTRMAEAADLKKKIKQYVKEHGSVDGLNIPGISFVKPL